MIVIGIDPGQKGAFAKMKNGELLQCADLPIAKFKAGVASKASDKERLHMFIEEIIALCDLDSEPAHEVHFFVERQQYFGEKIEKMTKAALARYFDAYGELRGYIKGRGWSLTLIPPVTWISATRTPGGKDGHIVRAYQVFPRQTNLFKGAKNQPKDGRCDAAMIAYYGHLYLTKGR